MNKIYTDVAVFIAASDQERNQDNADLYKKLIAEEYGEFNEAEALCDDVEELDACMDMIWVIIGYCHMRGWDVRGAWDEVARSNLDKINKETGKVIKRADGKVLKPDGWKAPQLEKYLAKSAK
jgi:predicted HAD superfamily Cof-like phosphohydrolase